MSDTDCTCDPTVTGATAGLTDAADTGTAAVVARIASGAPIHTEYRGAGGERITRYSDPLRELQALEKAREMEAIASRAQSGAGIFVGARVGRRC